MPSNDEIRLQILKLLHDHEQENPGEFGPERDTMLKSLQDKLGSDVTEKQMDFNMLYLEEKNLVKLLKTIGLLWNNSNITSYGTDVIEHKERYVNQFPFITVQIQNISESTIVGDVVQAQNQAQVVINKINEAFPKARQLTKTMPGKTDDEKREILKKIDELEQHIKDSDAGLIQKTWNWLKNHALELYPILQPVLIEVWKLIFQ